MNSVKTSPLSIDNKCFRLQGSLGKSPRGGWGFFPRLLILFLELPQNWEAGILTYSSFYVSWFLSNQRGAFLLTTYSVNLIGKKAFFSYWPGAFFFVVFFFLGGGGNKKYKTLRCNTQTFRTYMVVATFFEFGGGFLNKCKIWYRFFWRRRGVGLEYNIKTLVFSWASLW